jgi:hypothetical protein
VSFRNRLAKESKHVFALSNRAAFNTVLDRIAESIAPHYQLKELTDFIGDKSGRLVKRYGDAVRDIIKHGFEPHGGSNSKDMEISMFLKTEVYPDDKKDPRMISGCSTKFIVGFARHIAALEHAFANLEQVMGGKNLAQRGAAFQKLIYPHSRMRKTDYSRFDSSQRVELQWSILLGIIDRLFALGIIDARERAIVLKFFEQETEKHGRYSGGLTFKLIGCMASGSILTKFLNTLINFVVMAYHCVINNIPWDFLVDGDDGVLGYDSPISTHFHEFGLDVTDAEVYDYHDVDFCSSKFLMVRPGVFHQVQDFRKVYNNIGVLRSKSKHANAAVYYYSLGYMYSLLYPNAPGYSELSKFLMAMAPKERQHFSRDILSESHPQFDSWRFEPGLDFDYSLLLNEMVLAYGLSHGEFKYMIDTLRSVKITLPDDMCKRHRVVNAKRVPRPTDDECRLASSTVEQAVLTAKQPPLLRKHYNRQLYGFAVYTWPVPPKARR